MKKRARIGLVVLLFVAVIGWLAWLVSRSREPEYLGRTLNSWLEEYGQNFPYASETENTNAYRDQSKRAIQQIGTNALPALVRMAGTHDSSAKSNLIVLVSRLRLLNPHTEWYYRRLACDGFYALGPLAKDAVPSLIDLLKSQDAGIQCTAADCLGNIGPEAKAAVPFLIKFMDNTNRITRWDAMVNLGRIHSEADLVVPVLIKNLSQTNAPLAITIGALGEFGEKAKPAVPTILLYLNDVNAFVRTEATNALKRIDPEAAVKAGVR